MAERSKEIRHNRGWAIVFCLSVLAAMAAPLLLDDNTSTYRFDVQAVSIQGKEAKPLVNMPFLLRRKSEQAAGSSAPVEYQFASDEHGFLPQIQVGDTWTTPSLPVDPHLSAFGYVFMVHQLIGARVTEVVVLSDTQVPCSNPTLSSAFVDSVGRRLSILKTLQFSKLENGRYLGQLGSIQELKQGQAAGGQLVIYGGLPQASLKINTQRQLEIDTRGSHSNDFQEVLLNTVPYPNYSTLASGVVVSTTPPVSGDIDQISACAVCPEEETKLEQALTEIESQATSSISPEELFELNRKQCYFAVSQMVWEDEKSCGGKDVAFNCRDFTRWWLTCMNRLGHQNVGGLDMRCRNCESGKDYAHRIVIYEKPDGTWCAGEPQWLNGEYPCCKETKEEAAKCAVIRYCASRARTDPCCSSKTYGFPSNDKCHKELCRFIGTDKDGDPILVCLSDNVIGVCDGEILENPPVRPTPVPLTPCQEAQKRCLSIKDQVCKKCYKKNLPECRESAQ